MIALAAWLLSACERAPLSGPPDMPLGRHECKACGMLVSEDRCSSALLAESNGRREYFYYDDLGCMLDQIREGLDDSKIIEHFARDYNSRSWFAATDATFLFADPAKMQTPMGSGIVAFSTSSDAEKAKARFGGRMMGYADLAHARREWTEERYGRSKSQDGHPAGKGPP
ncbi:MAG: nitrous oxide reductase accessory protein NosL [Microbacteriaceae bacterium]|nr:nitrous oxide reductase accessory protein NosL [Microbacteriaceae bacterium]